MGDRSNGVGTPTHLDDLISRPYDHAETMEEYEAHIYEALNEQESQGLQYDQVLVDMRLFERRISSGLTPMMHNSERLTWLRQCFKREQELLPISGAAYQVESILNNRKDVLNRFIQSMGGSPGSVTERFGTGLGSPLPMTPGMTSEIGLNAKMGRVSSPGAGNPLASEALWGTRHQTPVGWAAETQAPCQVGSPIKELDESERWLALTHI